MSFLIVLFNRMLTITLFYFRPMYGYHAKTHQFFKIYLYNPLLIKKVSNLLTNSSTLGKIYQPHETHLNFTLQFMIDYNLHGMSNMIISNMKFRLDPNKPNSDIKQELFLPPSISKISVCELEGDILAEDIINRQEVMSGNINTNPGIAALWADEKQRRRNKGETSQIDHLLELIRITEPTKSHTLFKQALSDRLAAFSNEANTDGSNISGMLHIYFYTKLILICFKHVYICYFKYMIFLYFDYCLLDI